MKESFKPKCLVGYCTFLDAQDVMDFEVESELLDTTETHKLSNGSLIYTANSEVPYVNFDFFDINGWNGFVKIFLYDNHACLGWAHYVPEAGLHKEAINGTYHFTGRGLEVRGIWHDQKDEKWGFYLTLEEQKGGNPAVKKASTIRQRKEAFKGKEYKDILNRQLLAALTQKSRKVQAKKRIKTYNLYQHALNLRIKATSVDNLFLAICIAYSWMPTMLDIYARDKVELEKLLPRLKVFQSIQTLEDFDQQTSVLHEQLVELAAYTNRSIVGASKTLHILFPENVPIVDTRTLSGWNTIMRKHYRTNKDLKIPSYISGPLSRQASLYLKYWRFLLVWKENTKGSTIRSYEEPLYWVGKQ